MFASRVKSLTENQFLRHNAVFFAGSMAVAFLNYLYYPVVGRLLPNAAFGELQVIISTYLQLSIVLSVLSNVSINILVNNKDSKNARATIGELEKVSVYIGIGLLILIAIAAVPLANALKFSSPLPFIAIAVAFTLAVPSTLRTAYLQANKQFKSSSLISLVAASTKLLFSALFVLAALKTFGAVLGITLATAVSLFIANRQAVKAGFRPDEKPVKNRKPDFALIKPEIPFAIFVLVMTLLTTLQISIDVTLVKYYLPPEVAGNYAAIATVARIIYFLTGSVLAVMLSSIGPGKTARQNLRTLLGSGSLIAGLGGAATLFFVLFPVFSIHLLFGSRYDSLAGDLPLLAVAVFTGSLLNLFVTYNTSLRRYVSLVFLVLGSLTSLTFVILNTKSIPNIIMGLLIGSGVALIGLAAYTAVTAVKMERDEA